MKCLDSKLSFNSVFCVTEIEIESENRLEIGQDRLRMRVTHITTNHYLHQNKTKREKCQ